jgi:hypothetical protein
MNAQASVCPTTQEVGDVAMARTAPDEKQPATTLGKNRQLRVLSAVLYVILQNTVSHSALTDFVSILVCMLSVIL